MKTICIPTAVTRGAVFHYSGMYIHYVEQSTILCTTRKCMSKMRAILVYCVCVFGRLQLLHYIIWSSHEGVAR